MKHRHQHPSYQQRGGYGVRDEEWRYGQRGGGPWQSSGRGPDPQGRRAGPSQRDDDRYGRQSDYLSAIEGYGDIDEGYLPPAWDEAGPQHGGYRNTFASDTGGYGYGNERPSRERWQDEYPRGFAGYGYDREGRLQGPWGTRRDYDERDAGSTRFGQGYGSPSGGASWGGPRWNDPQHRDFQADYGRRQYARSPTDFMDERYPFGRDYGAGAGHYRQGPKGYQRSDQRIHEDVCERLSEDARIDASEIEVSVQGGVVTLKGTVPSRHMKYLAEDCADRCLGVKDVENRVRVEQQDHRDEELRSSTAGSGTYAGTAQKH